jgi:hypothetical protein
MSWGKGPLRGIRRLSDTIGGGSVTPTYTTTVITSSTTFVVGRDGQRYQRAARRGVGHSGLCRGDADRSAERDSDDRRRSGRHQPAVRRNARKRYVIRHPRCRTRRDSRWRSKSWPGMGRRRRCRRSGRHARQCRRRAGGRWRRVGAARLSSGPVRRCDLGERHGWRGGIIGLWWGRWRRVACQRVWPKRIQRRRQQGGPGQRLWRRQRRSW